MSESKTVWLVRHGLTVSNVSNTVQGLDDPLTPQGIEQAKKVAERFSKIEFDLLLSSDAARTLATAAEIAAKTNHIPEKSALLRETTYPSSLVGLLKTDGVAQKYFDERLARNTDSAWKYEDEESFDELKERTERAFSLLLERSEDRIVVVTHGRFLKLMTALVIFGDDFEISHWNRFDHSLRTLNTGITMLKWDGSMWHLLAWNDHAHLGE
jgi:broad specificity phosphatase PhoE